MSGFSCDLRSGFGGVFGVEGLGTPFQKLFVAPVIGLPAAVDAAAGTGHDFDGVVGRSAGADLFDQPAGVTQPVCDADFDGYAVEVDRRRTDSRQSAQFGEVEFRKRFFSFVFSYAVRTAASITPPVVPKMTPAPVDSPSGRSKSLSSSSSKFMLAKRIMWASSRVVIEMFTSGSPSLPNSGRAASDFFATQGMTDTTMKFRRSMPSLGAR